MTAWMRYPGRLAHLAVQSEQILDSAGQRRIGTAWRSACSKDLRVWWDHRTWQATWVDPLELRAETPRGWCLKCAYWAALDALILPARSFADFVALVHADRYPVVVFR